jgi:peptide deformylase
MTLLKILYVPDPVLKTKATDIETITPDIHQQAQDMLETMYAAPGIGLAANQIGRLNRLIVMDTAQREEPETRKPIVMINPEITWTSEEMSQMQEGCLSLPNHYADVERPRSVRVRYIDLKGQRQEILAEDLESHCVQHEIDHLNGVLFVDHLSRLKRSMLLKKFDKYRKEQNIL